MRLHELADNKGARKPRKRIGRGIGSGTGKTGGRGVKGQKSRSGVAINGFEGGQMPLYMRLPKRGFNKPNRKDFAEVNIAHLQAASESGKIKAGKIDGAALVEAGVLRRELDGVRLLGNGELSVKLDITVNYATPGAVAAIEKAGGSVTQTRVKKERDPNSKKANRSKNKKREA